MTSDVGLENYSDYEKNENVPTKSMNRPSLPTSSSTAGNSSQASWQFGFYECGHNLLQDTVDSRKSTLLSVKN